MLKERVAGNIVCRKSVFRQPAKDAPDEVQQQVPLYALPLRQTVLPTLLRDGRLGDPVAIRIPTPV